MPNEQPHTPPNTPLSRSVASSESIDSFILVRPVTGVPISRLEVLPTISRFFYHTPDAPPLVPRNEDALNPFVCPDDAEAITECGLTASEMWEDMVRIERTWRDDVERAEGIERK